MAAVTVTGLDKALTEIEKIQLRIADLTPVMQVIAEDLKTLVDDSFRNSKSPDGTGWAPLAESTIKRRRKGSSKPLVDTSNLRGSINGQATKRSAKIGTAVPYAVFHQFGTRHIPMRSFLPFSGGNGGFTVMASGPALIVFERARDMIVRYIKTGQIAG